MTRPVAGPEEVRIEPLDPRRLEPFIGEERVERLEQAAEIVRARLAGRRIVNVNSTAAGGGVAEMLRTLLGYAVGAGIDAHWLVIGGDAEFFAITKRLHNGLYGGPGDGGDLGPRERDAYERTITRNSPGVLAAIQPGDVVIVHDPQPAGLVPAIAEFGVPVVWRCHVGLDVENEWARRGWSFLRPYVEGADAFVFSRLSFAPAWVDGSRLAVIPPSIDPLAPKNEGLQRERVESVLAACGIISSNGAAAPALRPVRAVREQWPPAVDVPLVVQVSRWDRMKDMSGVLKGFVRGVPAESRAQLVLAGPAVDAVGDDPEDRVIWEETVALWQSLAPADRSRTHLVAVPMDDPVENALVINALQRHAAVVVQKSLAEGFGLTVAEAMWKARPMVASAVGGIVDQITDEESGLLLRDPADLDTFGALVARLLGSPEDAERFGVNALDRVSELFLPDRQLTQYASLLEHLVDGG
jgi:trehalose synthase